MTKNTLYFADIYSYIATYILTKLHFVDFYPHSVARYLATTADIRPNLTTVCLSVSHTGTDLLANSPAFIYMDKHINNNNCFFKYFSGITTVCS